MSMKTNVKAVALALLAVAGLGTAPAVGQVLYQQNFDVDDTANWTFTLGGGTDGLADFFFDYGTAAGIPAAPNSAGTTRGMKLQANIAAGVFGGGSASPNDRSFTGDYKVTFDLWSNYLGAVENNDATPDGVNPIGTTTGSTNLSTYGILTSGTFGNRAGAADGLFFANTGDASSSGFRIYSQERPVSYQLPITTPTNPDGTPNTNYCECDTNAIYAAGTRSTNPASATAPAGQLYIDAFPPVTVPAAQTALFPETQFGMTQPASFGFDWHAVEIAKVGNTATIKYDGVQFGSVDLTDFIANVGGSNIMFGHADVNASVSVDPYYDDVNFTLIDNVVVSTIVAPPVSDTDFDNDNDVDGADFLIWQQGLGIGTNNGTGDANASGSVDGADLALWISKYGGPPAVGAAGAVPEPGTAALAALALMAAGYRRRAAVA
jgi:hypothetical protein